MKKEELISLETARLAKENGYEQNPFRTEQAYAPINTDGSNVIPRLSLFNPSHNIAVAPTKTILHKWLRDEHKISVEVGCNASGWYWELVKSFNPTDMSGGTTIMEHIGEYSLTYEEALETGLYNALKQL